MKNEFKRLIKGTMAENFIDAIRTTDDGLSYSWNGFVDCQVALKDGKFLDRFDCEVTKLNNGDIGTVWQTERSFANLESLVKVLIKDAEKTNGGFQIMKEKKDKNK